MLLALTSSGCAQFTEMAGTPATPATDVPRECQRIAKKKVPSPKIAEGDDLLRIAGRYKAAYHKAEKRNEEVAKCEDRQADELAKGVH